MLKLCPIKGGLIALNLETLDNIYICMQGGGGAGGVQCI